MADTASKIKLERGVGFYNVSKSLTQIGMGDWPSDKQCLLCW